MATHSSVLAWRIPGKGEPGGLPSMESHRVGHDWSDLAAAWRTPSREETLLKGRKLFLWFSRMHVKCAKMENLCSVLRTQTRDSTQLFQSPALTLVPIDKQHAQTPSPRVLIHRLQPRHILTSMFSTYKAIWTGLDGLMQTHLHLGALVSTGQPRWSGNKPLAWTFQVTTQQQEVVCLPVQENWRWSRIHLQPQVPSEGKCFSKFNPYKNHLNGHWKFRLLHLLYIPDSVALINGSRNGISSDDGGGSCAAGTRGSEKPKLALHPTPPLPSPQDQHATPGGDTRRAHMLVSKAWVLRMQWTGDQVDGTGAVLLGRRAVGSRLLHPRPAHVHPSEAMAGAGLSLDPSLQTRRGSGRQTSRPQDTEVAEEEMLTQSTIHSTRCVPPADKTLWGDGAASYVVGALTLMDEICQELAPQHACTRSVDAIFWNFLGGAKGLQGFL